MEWNPWHGCRKFSPGCEHCYVYRIDAQHERDASEIKKNAAFDLPVQKKRDGSYRIPDGEVVYTCFSSDFLLAEADAWRPEAWSFIKQRSACTFFIITKRIDRLTQCLPPDWGDGYDNVVLCCTCENADRAAYRLPIYLASPLKHKVIICEPMLERIDLRPYLAGVDGVVVGGESGEGARILQYDWVLDIRDACAEAGTAFSFKQTGAAFCKGGRLYAVPRAQQHRQAKKAGIDLPGKTEFFYFLGRPLYSDDVKQ